MSSSVSFAEGRPAQTEASPIDQPSESNVALLLKDAMRSMNDALEKTVLSLTVSHPFGYQMVELEQTLNKEYHKLKKILRSKFYRSREERSELLLKFDVECASLRSIMVLKYNTVKQAALDLAVSRAVDVVGNKLKNIDVVCLVRRVSKHDRLSVLNDQIDRVVKYAVEHGVHSDVSDWLLSSLNSPPDMTDPAIVAQVHQELQFNDALQTELNLSAEAFRARWLAQWKTEEQAAPPPPPQPATAVHTEAASPPPPPQPPLTDAERLKQFREAKKSLDAAKANAAAVRAASTAAGSASMISAGASINTNININNNTASTTSIEDQRAKAAQWAATHLAANISKAKKSSTDSVRFGDKKSTHQQRADALKYAIQLYGSHIALHTPPSSPPASPVVSPQTRGQQQDKLRAARNEARRISVARAETAAVAAGTRAARFRAAQANKNSETQSTPSVDSHNDDSVGVENLSKTARVQNDIYSMPPVPASTATSTTRRRTKATVKKRSVPVTNTPLSPLNSGKASGSAPAPSFTFDGTVFVFGSTANTASQSSSDSGFDFKTFLPIGSISPSSPERNASLLDSCLARSSVLRGVSVSIQSEVDVKEEVDAEDQPCPPAKSMPVFNASDLIGETIEPNAKHTIEKPGEKSDVEMTVGAAAEAARTAECATESKTEERCEQEQKQEKERQLQEVLQREAQQEAIETAKKERCMAEKLAAEIRIEEEEAAVRAAEQAALQAVQDAIDAELAAKQANEDERLRAIEREREEADAAIRAEHEAEERAVDEAAAEAARLVAEEAQRVENERQGKERLDEEAQRQEASKRDSALKSVEKVAQPRTEEGSTSLSGASPDHSSAPAPNVIYAPAMSSPTAVNDVADNPHARIEPIEGDKKTKPVKRRFGVNALLRGLFGTTKKSAPPQAKS